MPNILIVDDEAIFRRGLRKIIESSSGSWQVAGEAKDGYEALEMVESIKPDVLLTDIRMPRMDGLQLIQIAKERFPKLLVIVLSGFDEFTYLQQSLRHGVRDYLMKPVEREELFKTLDKLETELAAPQPAIELYAAETADARIIRQHVSEHLVAGLLKGHVNETDLALLARIGVTFREPHFACMIIKLDKDLLDKERYEKADPSLFQLYIQQIVQELLDQRAKGFSFILSETEVVALVNLAGQPETADPLFELSETIRRRMISLSRLTVTIGIGRTVAGIKEVPQSFQEAKIAQLHRLIVGGDRVISYARIKQDGEELAWSSSPELRIDLIESAIQEGKPESTKQYAASFITCLCSQAKSPEVIHQQICKLLIHGYEEAEKLELTHSWLGERSIQAVLLEICSLNSRTELIDCCSSYLGKLAECIARGQRNSDRDPIDKVIRYVNQHYQEPLSLTQVAEQVYLNPAYLSTLFKQRTGTSLVEYWTDLRVTEAKKRLVSSNEKVTIIAESTGFGNIRHFNRVFKSVTGLAPIDYREQARSVKV
ncbi:two-component system, response regulator YesN [Paenibacillus catalpae]|uniref:Two-component system, response regulator YesN n=1 Tax=Paenibacillus catalpae TaxID=1045775 RepID=A0A1I1TEX0_9BACL|nr:response regulator [Paenibacillus catalpae]SFD54883.1 two-component system, response regulator YesN [Paenibacillus catalpae]